MAQSFPAGLLRASLLVRPLPLPAVHGGAAGGGAKRADERMREDGRAAGDAAPAKKLRVAPGIERSSSGADEAAPARPAKRARTADPTATAAGIVSKLLDTVHKFRAAEREFWERQQQLEAASKRMGDLCTEIEMLAVKLGQAPQPQPQPAPAASPVPAANGARGTGGREAWAMDDDDDDDDDERNGADDHADAASSSRGLLPDSPAATATLDPRRESPDRPQRARQQHDGSPWPARLYRPVERPYIASTSLVGELGSVTVAQVLRVRPEIKLKSFKRKPRTILVHPSDDEPLASLIVSSALDGQVHLWSNRKRAIVSQYCPSIEAKWVEDMCWLGGGAAFAMALNWGLDSKDDLSKCKMQLSVAAFSVESKEDDVRVRDFPLKSKPHSAAGIASVCEGPVRAGQLTCFTGGRDHKIFLWKIRPAAGALDSSDPWDTQVESVRGMHSSTVQALLCTDDGVLVSGGADKRLFMTDLARNVQLFQHRFSDLVSAVSVNPVDQQMLLVTTTGQTNQLSLFDCRNNAFVRQFGWKESKNISSYVKPSWSRDGLLIACPGVDRAAVQLWDIRYSDLSRPAQSLEIGEGTINHAVFHPREATLLTTADRSLAFSSYDVL